MNELTHYGVKGMRWGIRRRRPTTTSERRARAKRALKIAGAVAGGAALGYLGYKNRGAIANYSANRFSDAQRFARRNLTKAGMIARDLGSRASGPINARRQERANLQAKREAREAAHRAHRHRFAAQRLRNEHSKANIEFLRRKAGPAGKSSINSPTHRQAPVSKIVANHQLVSGRHRMDPRRSFSSQVAEHRHRSAPSSIRSEAKNNMRFVGPNPGSSKSKRKNRGVYGSYK